MVLWELFVSFFKTGILGYGGGPGSIPLIKEEVVGKYAWLTEEGFVEALAFGNALPGPIATKLAGYIGFKVAGVWGAVVSIAAAVIPTALAMILLYRIFLMYQHAPWIQGMLRAVKPVVAVLLLGVTLDVARTAFPGWTYGFIAVVAAVALFALNIHPAVLIAVSLVFGGVVLK